jgi:hypothetical protein
MSTLRMLSAAAVGALALSGCTTLREAATEVIAGTHNATLTGSQVVGGTRDADGYATAQLTVADALDNICYDINDTRNLGTVTSATINRGGMGRNGPVVVNLKSDETGDWKNCINRSEWLEEAIDANPSAYYVQVNTSTGSVRGQFERR